MKQRKSLKALVALLLVLCLIFQTGGFALAAGERVNYAAGKSVAVNNDVNMPQYFAAAYLTDGVTDCAGANHGYSSADYGTTDLSASPNTITIDLGQERNVDEIVLWPRNSCVTGAADAVTANFPVDFTIQVSQDGTGYSTVKTVTGLANPNGAKQSFTFDKVSARYVKLETTKIGLPENGTSAHHLQLAEIEINGNAADNQDEEPTEGPTTSLDGRVSIQDGMLVVPGGSAAVYHTTQSFSGDYTVEMRAVVDYQAVGLMLGNGNPNQALWCLALVDPYGVWIHQPGNWSSVNKVANFAVKQGEFITLKVQISGTTAVTSINDEVVDTCTLPASSTSGPIGLRFSNTESGKIDFIKVTQNDSVIFEDDFNFINGSKWDIPVPEEPAEQEYDVNFALNKAAAANNDVNMPQYFRQVYLTDGVTNCANPNFGFSSKQYASDDISSDPSVITVDLGADRTFNHLVLYPRNDVSTGIDGASSPNFMVDFTVQVSSDGVTYTDAYSIVDNPNPNGKAQGHAFEEVTGRYVKITTTKLGPLPTGEAAHYLQFAELEIYNRKNLALDKAVTANSDINNATYFNQTYLTDGIRGCQGVTHSGQVGNFGYCSKGYGSPDISADPNIISVDLGAVQTVNQISLYPRDDVTVNGGEGAANFPVTFDVQVSTDGTNFETVYSVENYECNSAAAGYIHSFDDHEARYVRVVTKKVSGLPANETTSYVQVSELEVYNRLAVPSNPGESVQRNFSDLPYAANSATQLLDIQLPSTGEGPYPVVVFFHGGAWLIGDKTDAESRGILNTALSKGYAVVNVNYRLASEAQWPAQIYDCKAAIRYIRANAEQYHFDTDRIAVLGASAGAHLAQMVGVTNGMTSMEDLSMGNAEYSSEVHAVVSLYGISDLTKWNYRESLFSWLGDPIKKLLGDDYTEEEALAASPITYVSENTVPFLIAHGQNDTLVEPEQSYTLEAKLKETIDPELVDTYYPANGPHGDASFWNTQEPIDQVMAFLQKRFEPNKPLTNGDNFRAYGSVDLSSYPNSTLNLQYANDSATQKLHIITPTTGEAPYPTIVFIHGGGFAGGNSSNGMALYTARGPLQALEKGYAVALVDYRCGGEAKYPAPVYDIKAAIRYLRANANTYQLDVDRFAIWGESAGGHLADFVALTSGDPNYEDLSMGNADYSSAIQAAVSWYAITNLTTDRNQQYAPTLLGYGASANYEGALDASPIAHVTKDVCPFYLQHGLADNEVEYQDSIQLYNLITAAAGEGRAKLELFPGINHAVKKFLEPENINKIIAWLDEQMPAAEKDIVFGEDTPTETYVSEYFPVSVTTPGDVQRIRLYNEYGLAIGMRDLQVTENEDGTRTFAFQMAVGTVGDNRVFTVRTYTDGVETITRAKLRIDIKARGPQIVSAAFTEDVGVINGNVTVRVVTDKNTAKVNLYNEFGVRLGVKSRSYVDTDEGRVWNIVTSFGNDGVRSLYADAQNKYGAKSEKLLTSNQIKIVVMLLG